MIQNIRLSCGVADVVALDDRLLKPEVLEQRHEGNDRPDRRDETEILGHQQPSKDDDRQELQADLHALRDAGDDAAAQRHLAELHRRVHAAFFARNSDAIVAARRSFSISLSNSVSMCARAAMVIGVAAPGLSAIEIRCAASSSTSLSGARKPVRSVLDQFRDPGMVGADRHAARRPWPPSARPERLRRRRRRPSRSAAGRHARAASWSLTSAVRQRAGKLDPVLDAKLLRRGCASTSSSGPSPMIE